MVKGEIIDVKKNEIMSRFIPINDILSSCLKRITAALTKPYDFCLPMTMVIDPLYVSQMLDIVIQAYCLRFILHMYLTLHAMTAAPFRILYAL